MRLLDYERGGKRNCAFLVRSDSVFGAVSRFLGTKGRAAIATPLSVAAARGTGFQVTYDAGLNQGVVEGKVDFRNGGGTVLLKAGQVGAATGNDPSSVSTLPTARAATLNARLVALRRRDKEEADKLADIEQDLLHTLDPVLQKIGFPLTNCFSHQVLAIPRISCYCCQGGSVIDL